MSNRIKELEWKLYCYKQRKLSLWGIKNYLISPYDMKLIEKLRGIYYGGIPASILLLCSGMSNGYCYDRATLLSRAFLDEEGDVRLIYAAVDGIRLNPNIGCKSKLDADHCIVERTTQDGQKLIYDTSAGLIYDKKLYWLMENPRIRKINDKEAIREFVTRESYYEPEDLDRDKYAMPLILPMIEKTYGRESELYSQPEVGLLQKEIKLFKEKIHYDEICEEISEDMKRMRKRAN